MLTVYVLQFIINDKTLHLLFSSYHWGVEVGPDIDMKFHQEVVEIVSYDKWITYVAYFANSFKNAKNMEKLVFLNCN